MRPMSRERDIMILLEELEELSAIGIRLGSGRCLGECGLRSLDSAHARGR